MISVLTIFPAALGAQIEKLQVVDASARPEAIDACLAAISQLSDVVKDASSYLPAYDQRSYSEVKNCPGSRYRSALLISPCLQQIRALSEKLAEARKALAPKQKFSFKNRRKDPAASIGGAFKVTASSRGPSAKSAPASGVPEADNLVISSRKLEHIILALPETTASSSFSSLLLSDLERCVTTFPLDTTLFSSAAVKNVKSSFLYLGGSINGPLHLTGLTNVVLVVACRQLRMHEATNVDVYILCPSRPIIEDCKNIRFAPLAKEGLGRSWEAVGRNMWDQVDDFKWLKSEHSPNWEVLPEAKRVQGRVWSDIRGSKKDMVSVKSILDTIVGNAVGM